MEPFRNEGLVARLSRWLPGVGASVLLLAVLDWVALRSGVVRHPPAVLAILVGVALVLFAARAAQAALQARRERTRRGSRLAEIGLLCGLMVSLLGGTANWLLGLQGLVILNERETVRLHGGTDLQVFEAGPLARLEEMGLFLVLDEVELVPAGSSGFYPRSRLRVWKTGEEPTRIEVAPRRGASEGPLRFHQGAFGFAPRIVILSAERTLFDRVVPFTTERLGPTGISFEGRFSVERERLAVEGVVDLASLDEGMRGHATLVLEVSRDGETLGRGSLSPGHFAELRDGYRVGFAGLEKWSEIDISRRNYGRIVRAGAAVLLVGAVFWTVARWRGW